MSIAQQTATPTPKSKARRPFVPLQPVSKAHVGSTLGRIVALMAATAFSAALLAGSAAIGMVMLASTMGG